MSRSARRLTAAWLMATALVVAVAPVCALSMMPASAAPCRQHAQPAMVGCCCEGAPITATTPAPASSLMQRAPAQLVADAEWLQPHVGRAVVPPIATHRRGRRIALSILNTSLLL